MSELRYTIARNLTFYRKRKKLTQGFVADQLGLDTSTLSKYENGVREPLFSTLEKMADLYEVSIVEIVGGISNVGFYVDNESKKLLEIFNEMPKEKKDMFVEMATAYWDKQKQKQKKKQKEQEPNI